MPIKGLILARPRRRRGGDKAKLRRAQSEYRVRTSLLAAAKPSIVEKVKMFDIKLRSIALFSGLAIMAATAAPGHAADATQPAVRAGLSEPVKAWRAAVESGDVAAMTRMHGPETMSFPPRSMSVEGVDTIMKGYAEMFATFTAQVTFEDAHYVEQPPLVVSWGLFKLTLHPKAGGADIVTRGRFTDAALKTGAGWRYVVDHASVPSAP